MPSLLVADEHRSGHVWTHRRATARLAFGCALILVATAYFADPANAQAPFEEAVVDVGNVGVTVTNAGYVGRASIRVNPTGPPSFEYPLDSGVEHLFEAGLWIGARRGDGVLTVRTGSVTTSGGYSPGAAGFEYAQASTIFERSTLPERDAFSSLAVSHQDYVTSFTDTSAFIPGTSIAMPDPSGRLGAFVEMESFAFNFPFAEYFVVLNFNITNVSDLPWDSVYVGLWHDLVVRNVNTTTDAGSAFFNKGGYGYIDSLYTTYAFNAGGAEETINTYGAITVLGAEWEDPATGQRRFFHPNRAAVYEQDGYPAPYVNPRWWSFSGGTEELSRPTEDIGRYERMATPYPNPANYASEPEYEQSREAWFERLRSDGLIATGNWIGLTPIGPFPRVEAGDMLQVTFALVAALKPDEFQGQPGKAIDTPESRAILANNILWARRTYSGEDNNFNGVLDPGEDSNNNGQLDRYVIPEPPSSPRVHVEFDVTDEGGASSNRATLYWDRSAEESIDPVTGIADFEGYRVYRSNPGNDLSGNLLDAASLVAQWDETGNRTGFNNGFDEVQLAEPATFAGDTTQYWYRFPVDNLLGGWQYLFTVTAFDEGDVEAGLPPFESSRTSNAIRVFPGTPPSAVEGVVGVYPNPYRVNAAWDGTTARTRRLNFYNLPRRAEVRIYTLAGEIVDEFRHDAATYTGDIRWYDNFSGENRVLSGGEHSWDLLSKGGLGISGGLYLFSVKDLDSGNVQTGKFVVIR